MEYKFNVVSYCNLCQEIEGNCFSTNRLENMLPKNLHNETLQVVIF